MTLSNKIYIEDATEQVLEWCKLYLEFPNPEYAKKSQMGLWVGNIEPKIVLWERKGDTVILPAGCYYDFEKQFGISLKRNPKPDYKSIHYNSVIEPFSYQQHAIDNSIGKSGVLVMPCGSGKTQTALEIVAKYGRRTLWITHTHELLLQSLNRAKACFNMEDDMYGTITGGRVDIGKAITFATVQTLAKIDLSDCTNYWDVVIVDECHKAVGTPTKLMMFYKVISMLNAQIKLGLTATPKRNDGLERCMFALLGPKLCEISEDAVKKNTVPICVTVEKSNIYHPDMNYILNGDGTINYSRLIDDVCSCSKRNIRLAEIVNSINSQGMTCLVLSDRVEHLRVLRQLVGEDYTMQMFASVGSKKAQIEREECIDKLKSKQIRCLFATYQLAKEGLDVPSLDCVVFATPKKDEITIVQSCGRVGRKSLNKHLGYVIDFVDQDFSVFENYGRIRQRIYKKKKYQIIFINL